MDVRARTATFILVPLLILAIFISLYFLSVKLILDDWSTDDRKAEWDGFVSLLDRSCYWQLAAENDEMGNDGAQWILEGIRDGRYHVVDRWTPRSGDYREACLDLLQLSNLGIALSGEDVY